jgi:hypothetical protein
MRKTWWFTLFAYVVFHVTIAAIADHVDFEAIIAQLISQRLAKTGKLLDLDD